MEDINSVVIPCEDLKCGWFDAFAGKRRILGGCGCTSEGSAFPNRRNWCRWAAERTQPICSANRCRCSVWKWPIRMTLPSRKSSCTKEVRWNCRETVCKWDLEWWGWICSVWAGLGAWWDTVGLAEAHRSWFSAGNATHSLLLAAQRGSQRRELGRLR